MWRLTLAQMRRTAGRLVAVGIAIALGTAFITATFLATGTIQATAMSAARAGVGDPDLVLMSSDYSLTDASLAQVESLDGVAAVQPLGATYREVVGPQGSEYLALAPPASDPRLGQVTLVEGAAPASAGELAIPAGTASRLGVTVGDSISIVSQSWPEGDADPVRLEQDATVTGITSDGSGLGFGMPTGLATPADITEWRAADGSTTWGGATIALTDPGVRADVTHAVAALDPTATVLTGEEYAQQVAASFTGGVSVFRGLILSFAAVAMAVAGIVIANTFTVLVAQRIRTLALLRCVGATRGQVRTSVRREALLLGVASSVVGVLAGLSLGQLVLTVLGRANDGVPLPTVVPVDVWTILVPLAVGIVVTVLAAGGAARAATRVAPLAALRPSGEPGESAAPGRRSTRALVGWSLVGLGFAVMIAAVLWSRSQPQQAFLLALGVGVLGGLLSMLGVVLAAISLVPALVRVLGRVTSLFGGTPGRLAATNAVRNPARTTSTATALIVGVALVTMMTTGAGTVRSQLDTMLESQFAIDVAVTPQPGQTLSAATIEAITEVDGVTGSALMDTATAEVTTGAGADASTISATVLRVDRIPEMLDVLRSAPRAWERGAAYADGYLLPTDGAIAIEGVGLMGKLLDGLPDYSVLVDTETFALAGLTPDSQTLWLSVADGADPRDVVAAVTEAVSSTSPADTPTPAVSGSAVERAGYAQIIDTLLVVVIGLLGVAVIIALLGVANTLSLSVVERRQENALLRALGLTRRQLRASLAVEGVLLAVVGALVGVVIGVAYGWFGSELLLGPASDAAVPLTVPWGAIGLVTLVAVVAGVIASVLPARGAARVPPVVALGA